MSKRSYLLTLLLAISPMGLLGFDRFYLGKIGTGILKLASHVTLVGGFIWYIIDIFLVLYNQQTDIKGEKLAGQEKRDPLFVVILSLCMLDRFYLGQTALGVVKILTLGGLGVWYLIDIYLAIKGNVKDARDLPIEADDKKYQSVALLLCLGMGTLGIDRFYLGHRSMGLMKLITFGGFGMWVVMDFILIILNSIKDSNGKELVQE